MSKITILEGMMVAAVLGAAAALWTVGTVLFFPYRSLSFACGVLALLYIGYILVRARGSGRLLAGACSVVVIPVLALLVPTFQFLTLLICWLWLMRSLFCYSSFILSGLDFALTVISYGCAVWVFAQSGSFVGAVWIFFLVQALTALIPQRMTPAAKTVHPDAFARSYDTAQRAIEQIARRA